jgi:hypothetical protein
MCAADSMSDWKQQPLISHSHAEHTNKRTMGKSSFFFSLLAICIKLLIVISKTFSSSYIVVIAQREKAAISMAVPVKLLSTMIYLSCEQLSIKS